MNALPGRQPGSMEKEVLFVACSLHLSHMLVYLRDAPVGTVLGAATLREKLPSVSQGRTCWDSFRCCHTEREVADQTFCLTQSLYTDTGPTSPSVDPTMPRACQGSHGSTNFSVTGMTQPGKKIHSESWN